jgi:4'-phosphopantetheinyl transferase
VLVAGTTEGRDPGLGRLRENGRVASAAAKTADPAPAGVLLAGPTASLAASSESERWLTPAELERANALRRPADRADFVAAHVLARRCAARLLDADPGHLTINQYCPVCCEPGHGRPTVAEAPDLHISFTHTRGYVAAAADTAEIAVDAEHVITEDDPGRLDGLAAAVLTPSENALLHAAPHPERTFAALWVRKEALIKLGLADLDTLTALDVSAALPDTATYGDYTVLGWTAGQVVGVVIARRVPRLIDLR